MERHSEKAIEREKRERRTEEGDSGGGESHVRNAIAHLLTHLC